MYKVYKDNNLTIKSITKKSVADCIKESVSNFQNTILMMMIIIIIIIIMFRKD